MQRLILTELRSSFKLYDDDAIFSLLLPRRLGSGGCGPGIRTFRLNLTSPLTKPFTDEESPQSVGEEASLQEETTLAWQAEASAFVSHIGHSEARQF